MRAFELVGTYEILGNLPLWFLAPILCFLCIGILHVGREMFEGFAYNISRASQYGDGGLIVCILIGATVVKRGRVPELMNNETFLWTWATLSIIVGVVWELVIYYQNGRKWSAETEMER